MLAYAFQELRKNNYEYIASEPFDNIHDMFAAILVKGVSKQLKQGLYREYILINENLVSMRGKLDINGTIRNKIQNSNQLCCEYDELSENNILNQILKTTMNILVAHNTVKPEHKRELKKLLLFFDNVDMVPLKFVNWNTLCFRSNNQSYEMLMYICYFVMNSQLMTTESGEYRMMSFKEDLMSRLYEKFVLEYYRQHFRDTFYVSSKQIHWNIEDDLEIPFLPQMQSDIMLINKANDKTLIIDTKYYSHIMQTNYDTKSYHSNNMYQIFTYVKNYDKNNTGNVSGILLYAKTDETVLPDEKPFKIGRNNFSVKTLDLNTEFSEISNRLNEIIKFI